MLQAQKILVPVKGNSTDASVVALAAQTAKRNRGQLFVVHVVEVPLNLPLTAELAEARQHADSVLDSAETTANEYGQDIQTEILQARDIATAVVEEACDVEADLVIIGLPYRRRLGQFDLGKTILHILESAPCEVWICREPLPSEHEPVTSRR